MLSLGVAGAGAAAADGTGTIRSVYTYKSGQLAQYYLRLAEIFTNRPKAALRCVISPSFFLKHI